MKKQIENKESDRCLALNSSSVVSNTQCNDCEINFMSEYHLQNHLASSKHLLRTGLNRKFGYKLNQKATKAKLLKGAQKAPFEKEIKSTCLVLNFSDGSYFYSVLPLIEFWKSKLATQDAIKSDDFEIKVSEVKPGKEIGGMCVDTLVRFEMNGNKVVVHCYNTKAKMLLNGSGFSSFSTKYLEPYIKKAIGESLAEIQNYNKVVTETFSNGKRKDLKFGPRTKLACNKCNFSSTTSANLSAHRKSAHTDIFSSGLENRALTSTRDNSIVDVLNEDVSAIELLEDSHSGSEIELEEKADEPNKFQCYECQKGFEQLEELSGHVRKCERILEKSVNISESGSSKKDAVKINEDTMNVEASIIVDERVVQEVSEIPDPSVDKGEAVKEKNDSIPEEIIETIEEAVSKQVGENPAHGDNTVEEERVQKEYDADRNVGTDKQEETVVKTTNEEVLLENFTFACEECGYQFEGKDKFDAHHLDSARCLDFYQLSKCRKCSLQLESKDSLKKHMEEVHLIMTFYNCTSCKFRSTVMKEFKIHVDTNHLAVKVDIKRVNDIQQEPLEGLKKVECVHCPYKCKFNIQLKKHCMAKHQTYECDECPFVAATDELFVDHKNCKHAAKRFKCDLCEYHALTPFEMFAHKVSMHQSYQQFKPETVYDMQELFLTGLARQVDSILENVVKSKDEVLEQLDVIKNKNNNLETELMKTRVELNDVKAALGKSNAFNANMQSDSEAMLKNIADRCQKLEKTAEKLSNDIPDIIEKKKEVHDNAAKPHSNTPGAQTVRKERNHNGLKKKHKVAWVGTSISKQLDKNKFEADLDAELVHERAYCIGDEPNAYFRDKNFKAIVPELVKNCDMETLVLQTGSIEISNIDVNHAVMDSKKHIDQYKKEWFAKVEEDSNHLFDLAEDALKNSSSLKRIILIKRLPRFDRSRDDIIGIKSQLSNYGNNCYDQQFIKRGRPDNIHIVELDGLDSQGYLRSIVYGEVNKENYDGIHLRGRHASRHFSYRVISAIKRIIKCSRNPINPRVNNERKADFHRTCPQAKYQAQKSQANQKPSQFSSQSKQANSGHQSAFSTQGVRYSDVVTGGHNYYNVPTQNKYAPLN